jgi:hypothetical protein
LKHFSWQIKLIGAQYRYPPIEGGIIGDYSMKKTILEVNDLKKTYLMKGGRKIDVILW